MTIDNWVGYSHFFSFWTHFLLIFLKSRKKSQVSPRWAPFIKLWKWNLNLLKKNEPNVVYQEWMCKYYSVKEKLHCDPCWAPHMHIFIPKKCFIFSFPWVSLVVTVDNWAVYNRFFLYPTHFLIIFVETEKDLSIPFVGRHLFMKLKKLKSQFI